MHIRWRGLELPSVVECDRDSLTPTYGKFVAEPFERGFGTTVGNSLRRVLLSSLQGSAVTQLKIRGANHEFSSIPGVLEDVTEIVLNVKSLVVKNYTDQMKVITIEKSTPGPITGADIQTGGEVDIINADHVLTTLTDENAFVDNPFMMEMVVENGGRDHEIGIVPIDAVYSPVTRVRYDVEETRVGQKTNYDRLTLEIWTNGSINPEMSTSTRSFNTPNWVLKCTLNHRARAESMRHWKPNSTCQSPNCVSQFERPTAWIALTFAPFAI